jgi:general secretion pathway protein G
VDTQARASAPLPDSSPAKKPTRWGLFLALGCAACVGGVILLGVLAAIVAPNLLQRIEFARHKMAEIDVIALSNALDTYAAENGGAFPATLEVLLTPDEQGRTVLNGYASVPLDPWGNPYQYLPAQGSAPPRIQSFGKDGRPGGTGENADVDSQSLRTR